MVADHAELRLVVKEHTEMNRNPEFEYGTASMTYVKKEKPAGPMRRYAQSLGISKELAKEKFAEALDESPRWQGMAGTKAEAADLADQVESVIEHIFKDVPTDGVIDLDTGDHFEASQDIYLTEALSAQAYMEGIGHMFGDAAVYFASLIPNWPWMVDFTAFSED